MPELPEVETLRRSLVQSVQGCIITDVVVSHRHRGVNDEALPVICGSQIEDIKRIGKFLTLRVGFRHLVIHLGMSGRLLVRDSSTYRASPHDHVRISTDDNKFLVFQDHRRFGRVFLSPLDLSGLPAMGPDPLRNPISASYLSESLSRRSAAIKVLLMEQATSKAAIYRHLSRHFELRSRRGCHDVRSQSGRRIGTEVPKVTCSACFFISTGGPMGDDLAVCCLSVDAVFNFLNDPIKFSGRINLRLPVDADNADGTGQTKFL